MAPRTKFPFGFSGTMQKVNEYDSLGLSRSEVGEKLGLTKSSMSKGLRIYLTSLGKTPDSGNLEVKNKAIELVKRLDADDISLHNADVELVGHIRRVTGKEATYRRANTTQNPDQQLIAYKRAVASLEGICHALDTMPEVIHSGIIPQQRQEIERRLASCRRIIERRINIIRKDDNAEAAH